MPRDFLFDIGNVILRFDFSTAIDALKPRSANTPDNPLGAIEDIKHQLEAGEIDDDTFVSQGIDILGFDGTPAEFAQIWCEIFELNTPIAKLIEKLSASGNRLYLLSNTSGLHKDYFFDAFPIFGAFQGGVYSHTARSMKPEDGMYLQAIDAFGLAPESTVYIDDNEDNVASGNRLGLQSILYNPDRHEEIIPRLEALGVEV
jgi:putative hydrolase of the HAD superfamily